jgi:hypothetical protein
MVYKDTYHEKSLNLDIVCDIGLNINRLKTILSKLEFFRQNYKCPTFKYS